MAGLVTLARNTKVLLGSGEIISASEKERMVKDEVVSAGTAGFLSLLLG